MRPGACTSIARPCNEGGVGPTAVQQSGQARETSATPTPGPSERSAPVGPSDGTTCATCCPSRGRALRAIATGGPSKGPPVPFAPVAEAEVEAVGEVGARGVADADEGGRGGRRRRARRRRPARPAGRGPARPSGPGRPIRGTRGRPTWWRTPRATATSPSSAASPPRARATSRIPARVSSPAGVSPGPRPPMARATPARSPCRRRWTATPSRPANRRPQEGRWRGGGEQPRH